VNAKKSFRIVAADHTGITVSNLERSLAFWREVLGFELSHTAHQTGEMAKEITGVVGAEIKLAVLRSPGGHKIELLEYLAPADGKQHVDLRPCDVGSVHVALLVDNLDVVLEKFLRPAGKRSVNRRPSEPVRTRENVSSMFATPTAPRSNSCSSRKPIRPQISRIDTDFKDKSRFSRGFF
jgi:catechol 2,3-dioxygenase-like lactoylglutathione lyase family enzyme